MGHPLLDPRARVRNDLRLGGAGETLIITGSNMSGKSTLLRTVGVNLALAYAGGPVCAEAFGCDLFEVHTSMRLRDDLEKRISSFYAELLRLKTLVEAARAGRPVLFLVDEIFRGTNSKDRHAGAAAVLRRLRDLGASGLVSTHDLDLAALADEDPAHFRNFHFEEHFDGGRIAFDFKLRPGVSTTTNAIHLIRMVGLA
jgi:DNA mismatch repair ATPase MutS